MRYVISGMNGSLSQLKRIINKIQAEDSDAIFILLGNQMRDSFSWELLSWMMQNVTPNGKYQAVLSREGFTILEWYNNKYLPYRQGVITQFPFVERETSSVLYHAKSLDHKDIVELADFYKSLPAFKRAYATRGEITHTYYIVESWVNNKLLKGYDIQNRLTAEDLRSMLEYCLYFPVDYQDYADGRYRIIRADYNGYAYERRDTIAMAVDSPYVFCIDTEKFYGG